MADEAAIREVTELLPADATTEGWTDERVGSDLDSGKTKAAILAQFWNARAASSASLVSISESGSSRDLSVIHKNAISLAQYWQGIADKEAVPEDDLGVRRRVAFHRARRV